MALGTTLESRVEDLQEKADSIAEKVGGTLNTEWPETVLRAVQNVLSSLEDIEFDVDAAIETYEEEIARQEEEDEDDNEEDED
jgi:hypothetical protein